MTEEQSGNYIYGVMNPQKYHEGRVDNCCKYRKGCPPWPSNSEKLQNVDHTRSNMPRVKEVWRVSIRNSEAGKARIIPLMPLWILKYHKLLHHDISCEIEKEVSKRKPPSGTIECKSVELSEVHYVQERAAEDYKGVPLLFILEVIINGLSPLECSVINTCGTIIF